MTAPGLSVTVSSHIVPVVCSVCGPAVAVSSLALITSHIISNHRRGIDTFHYNLEDGVDGFKLSSFQAGNHYLCSIHQHEAAT